MARKIVVVSVGQSPSLLSESQAQDELQLQETMKENPDLLPIDEFGMGGPVLIVGRETSLPSGAVDLVAIARTGELLIVEFKTGPSNPDFRAVLAQLLDYGSDLWGMTFEQFEETVALPYFASTHFKPLSRRRFTSLKDAAADKWDMTEEALIAFRDSLNEQLSTGGFHYIAVAQHFAPATLRTIEYLNASTTRARFYAVEMVRFTGESASAFESRTILKPSLVKGTRDPIDRARFLGAFPEGAYRDAVSDFLTFCEGMALIVDYGTAGLSLRINPGTGSPLSVGWIFPPGRAGWMGLTQPTFGFDPSSLKSKPELRSLFEEYLSRLTRIPEATTEPKGKLCAVRIAPNEFGSAVDVVKDAILQLVSTISQGNPE